MNVGGVCGKGRHVGGQGWEGHQHGKMQKCHKGHIRQQKWHTTYMINVCRGVGNVRPKMATNARERGACRASGGRYRYRRGGGVACTAAYNNASARARAGAAHARSAAARTARPAAAEEAKRAMAGRRIALAVGRLGMRRAVWRPTVVGRW